MDINALPNNEEGVGRYSVVGGEGELQIWAVEATHTISARGLSIEGDPPDL